MLLLLFISKSSQTLCDPMDCSPPDSSVHGILQARILEWVATSFSKGSSQTGVEPSSPALASGAEPVIILSEMSDRERQIPYDLIYM